MAAVTPAAAPSPGDFLEHPACFGEYHPVVHSCAGCSSAAACIDLARNPPKAAPLPEGDKHTNPKDIIGCDKLPLHLWPTTATAMGCLGMLEGLTKYGRANFRESGIRPSIYVDACKRHLDAWFEGEECAPDSGLPHLANALACIAIIIDARAAGKMVDDRNYRGAGYRKLVNELTPHVARIKALNAHKTPRHYTLADEKAEAGDAE